MLIKPHILFLCLAFVSCASRPPSEKVAREFIESYYVETDLKRAELVTEGLAQEKIRTSLALVEGQSINEGTRRPTISYDLLQSQIEGGEASYQFRVTIKPPDFPTLQKKSRIKLREREGVWKVTQFSDYDFENH